MKPEGKDIGGDKHANSVCLHNSQTALFLGGAVRKIDRQSSSMMMMTMTSVMTSNKLQKLAEKHKRHSLLI